MTEAPITADQTGEKASAVLTELEDIDLTAREMKLERLRDAFPEVVEDATNLWEALKQDDIKYLRAQFDEKDFPVPLLHAINLSFLGTGEVSLRISNSPNWPLYDALYRKYQGKRPNFEHTKLDVIFAQAFNIVRELPKEE